MDTLGVYFNVHLGRITTTTISQLKRIPVPVGVNTLSSSVVVKSGFRGPASRKSLPKSQKSIPSSGCQKPREKVHHGISALARGWCEILTTFKTVGTLVTSWEGLFLVNGASSCIPLLYRGLPA